MPRAWQLYAAVAGVYVASRVVLAVLGVPFEVSYGWQHFHDVDLLKDRLGESLLYTHAFAPAMNLLVGVVLKLGGEARAPAVYHALFLASGLGLALSVAYLLEVLRTNRWLTLILVCLFMCSPTFIYFEKLFHYEFLTAALLALDAVLLHRALVSQRSGWWLGFFLVAALLTYVRLTFHLVWMAALVGLAVLFQPRNWRPVALAAVVPLLLVLAPYVKNQVLFGFFGASSRAGFTMALVTIHRLPGPERQRLIEERKIHPLSATSVYQGADAFGRDVDLGDPTGIAVLDRVRRLTGEPNYNHAGLIRVNRIYMRDGQYVLRQHPGRYLGTVGEGLVDYFRPSTRWHPRDPDGSPHRGHRVRLEPWENAYNTVLHRFPYPPFGLYLLLVPLALYGGWRAAATLWRRRLQGSEPEKLILFLLFNSAFVPALSCLVAIGELERYRFIVEAFLWIAALWSGRQLAGVLRRRPAD